MFTSRPISSNFGASLAAAVLVSMVEDITRPAGTPSPKGISLEDFVRTLPLCDDPECKACAPLRTLTDTKLAEATDTAVPVDEAPAARAGEDVEVTTLSESATSLVGLSPSDSGTAKRMKAAIAAFITDAERERLSYPLGSQSRLTVDLAIKNAVAALELAAVSRFRS